MFRVPRSNAKALKFRAQVALQNKEMVATDSQSEQAHAAIKKDKAIGGFQLLDIQYSIHPFCNYHS